MTRATIPTGPGASARCLLGVTAFAVLVMGLLPPLPRASVARAAGAAAIHDDLPAIRNKVLLHEERHAIAPVFGLTINDAYSRNIMLGGSWRYFMQSWLGLGVDALGGLGFATGLTDQINDELSQAGSPFELETTDLRLVAAFMAELVPIEGKVMVLGRQQVRSDWHLTLGFGMAMVSGEGRIEDSLSMMPVFGTGVRIFPTSWISLGIDIRDHLIKRSLAIRRDGSVPGESFGHNVLVSFAVSFFLPERPKRGP